MKVGRMLGAAVGGFAALAALLLLSVWLIVDPNHYKSQIAAAVREATGRELILSGDIHLSVLPWIALQLGPASLGNLPGFGPQPFVSFRHAAVRVRLLPLLSKRLQIGRVELDGVEVRLVRNADGRGNWQGMAPDTGHVDAGGDGRAGALRAFAGFGGIKVTNGRVSYGAYLIDHLNLETGAFASNELVPVTLGCEASRGVAGEQALVDARFDVSGEVEAGRYHAAALTVHGSVNPAGEARSVNWDFSAPVLDADLKAQTLRAPAMTLSLAGAEFRGSLDARSNADAYSVSGTVSLTPLVLREFLPRLGLRAPSTRDPRALSRLAASFSYSYGANSARLDDLKVTVDDTHLTGGMALVDVARRSLQFALAVDAIDLDRYLAPRGTAPAAIAQGNPGAGAAAMGVGAGAAVGVGAGAGLVGGMPLDAQGTLNIGSVHLAPLDLAAVSVTVAAGGGVIHLFPLQAEVDGGRYSGNVELDERGRVPLLIVDEHLTGIEVGRLASAEPKGVHLSGRGTVTLKAVGRGADPAALLKTLNGHLDAAVMQGAIEGVDVGFQLARAEALLQGQAQPGSDTKRTPFDALTMSADITGGVARTQDLVLSSPVLKVTGQGTVDLPTQIMEMALLADTLRTFGGAPIQIPLSVTGPVADPAVRPDLASLARSQLRRRVEDVLKDKLKGLFSR